MNTEITASTSARADGWAAVLEFPNGGRRMKTTPVKPTIHHARKILDLLSHGLTSGLGKPEPGKMCVEAAVSYAFDLPHGDDPACVGEAVRAFKIRLNDCQWSTNTARADGMRQLAIAQLGSDELDQMDFGKLCYLRGVQTLLPFVLRAAAEELPDGERKTKLLGAAEKCAAVKDFAKAEHEAKSASASAYGSGYASASASAYAYASAYASASASASASAYASASAFFRKHLGDKFLRMTAQMGLGVLIEMKSPGCRWLKLCPVKTLKTSKK